MYCKKCGQQVDDNAMFCPYCVESLQQNGYYTQQSYQTQPTKNGEQDGSSAGFNVLSFFFPLVGLILYIVWKDSLPIRAKNIGKWALIGFCVGVGIEIIISIVWALAFGSFFGALYSIADSIVTSIA
jgi:uncharacterized membrane protein YvbJ